MRTLLEEYGAIIFYLIVFGILITYFYHLEIKAANGNLMNTYQGK